MKDIASTFSQHVALIYHCFGEKDVKWLRTVGIAHIVITLLGQEGNQEGFLALST